MDTPSIAQFDAIERARYKLRQAELALQYLRQIPGEIAIDMRRARPIRNPDIRLDTFFFACLRLAKSAYLLSPHRVCRRAQEPPMRREQRIPPRSEPQS